MIATRILRARFPDAVGGILGGSVARGEDRESSDVDLVVVLDGAPAPMRCTEHHAGRLVEFFVHTDDSFREFVDRERRLRRSPLVHMAAFGVVVDDDAGRVADLRDHALRCWSGGPPALGPAEVEDRRYRLTALLEDLRDEADPGCSAALATAVFLDVADLALVARGAWSGTGRWLVRRLREVDGAPADRLVEALRAAVTGRPDELLAVSRAELDRLGGPLDEGYVRRA